MPDPLVRIRRGATILGAVFVVAVLGHHWLTGKPWLESIYFFVITVSGVGYAEESRVSPSVQVFTILVIVFGMLAAFYTIGALLQSMIEGEIRRAIGARRMSREISQLDKHVVICGYGRTGRILAEDLALRGVPFVLVELNPEAVSDAELAGHLVIAGDATEEDLLRAVGIERAKTIIVALPSDADNVFLTLTARNLNADLHIIARGELPPTEKKLRQAGADQVVMPAVIGARQITNLITRPHAAELMDLVTDRNRLDVDLAEIPVTQSGRLVGKSVREAAPRQQHHVLIVAVRRADGTMVFNPEPNLVMAVGDTAIVMGHPVHIEHFQDEFRV